MGAHVNEVRGAYRARERMAPVHGLDILAAGQTAALDIFVCIEVVYSRARIHSALGYMSPAELEEADWPDDEGRPRAA